MPLSDLFRTKHPEAHSHGEQNGLKACLGPIDLIFLGIGCIIGTGIFVLTGIVAATQTGPSIVVSFVISGIICAFAALSYAELAGSIGGCGSAYGYCYTAFGELVAWIVGWALILEYGVAVAAVANGWSGYFGDILLSMNVHLPFRYVHGPLDGGTFNVPAASIVLLLMLLLLSGAKHGARLNAAMVFLKLSTIAVFIAIASQNVHPEYWTPFAPFGWYGENAEGTQVGILGGASMVFFAYIGFDAVSTAAEETKNPAKDLPIGIIVSLLVATILYIAVAGLLTGIAPYTELNVQSPISHALGLIGFRYTSGLVGAGAIAGITTVMFVCFYGLTRIIFSIGRDGLLPRFLAKVRKEQQTPISAIVLCGTVISLAAGLFPLHRLAEVVNIGTLLAFFIVCVGVVVLRIKHPELPRPFKVPFGPTIPILGAIAVACLGIFLSGNTWKIFFLWQAIGLVIYFGYSFRHSGLRTKTALKNENKKPPKKTSVKKTKKIFKKTKPFISRKTRKRQKRKNLSGEKSGH